ncbi:MAG: hypothetical protein KAS75_08010 [Planctomycetes bacterium]|nr:hypothetical protein [Planctomycetota bacterium]
MYSKKRTVREKKSSEQQMLENEAQKHAVRSKVPFYNQIDPHPHRWANKMEIFRILSS